MSRLVAETQRLFSLPAETADRRGPVRHLVLALSGPADWNALAPLWRGVQTDFLWPEAAIAVNGRDAFEIWFPLAEPLPRADAAELLALLQHRYLGGVPPERLHAWPGADANAASPGCPPFSAGPERWAAFVTPDLPAVFGDDPALDFEPGADAQAELLSRLRPVSAAGLRTARAALGLPRRAIAVSPTPSAPVPPAPASAATGATHAATPGKTFLPVDPWQEPRAFLQAVMNDPEAPLAHRIEAAKALLLAPPAPSP